MSNVTPMPVRATRRARPAAAVRRQQPVNVYQRIRLASTAEVLDNLLADLALGTQPTEDERRDLAAALREAAQTLDPR